MPIVRKISHTDVLNPKDMLLMEMCFSDQLQSEFPSPAYEKLFECEIKFELNTPVVMHVCRQQSSSINVAGQQQHGRGYLLD